MLATNKLHLEEKQELDDKLNATEEEARKLRVELDSRKLADDRSNAEEMEKIDESIHQANKFTKSASIALTVAIVILAMLLAYLIVEGTLGSQKTDNSTAAIALGLISIYYALADFFHLPKFGINLVNSWIWKIKFNSHCRKNGVFNSTIANSLCWQNGPVGFVSPKRNSNSSSA